MPTINVIKDKRESSSRPTANTSKWTNGLSKVYVEHKLAYDEVIEEFKSIPTQYKEFVKFVVPDMIADFDYIQKVEEELYNHWFKYGYGRVHGVKVDNIKTLGALVNICKAVHYTAVCRLANFKDTGSDILARTHIANAKDLIGPQSDDLFDN